MKSIILTFVLLFSTAAFADIENGTYECNIAEDGESYTFKFDLTDEYMAAYDDDNVSIETIFLIDGNMKWINDGEGGQYKVMREANSLKTIYENTYRDENTGEVVEKERTQTYLKQTTDGKFLLEFTDYELDIVTDQVISTGKAFAICTMK